MENTIAFVSSNKLLIGILVFLTILLVFSLIKRIIKFVFTVLVVILLFAAYLNYFGKRPLSNKPLAPQEQKQLEKLKQTGSDVLKKIQN